MKIRVKHVGPCCYKKRRIVNRILLLFLLLSWLMSMFLIVRLVYKQPRLKSRRVPTVTKDLQYATDDEPFAQLVNQTYDDKYLFEWEPAPPIPHKADEPGHLGKQVKLTAEQQKIADARFSEHMINVVASDLMSLNRTLPENRPPKCLSVKYPKKLPQTAVVVIFHNEAFSVLMRTVWNIYSKSPRALIKEIILVDDASTHGELHQKLEKAIKTVPVKVVLVRMIKRAGLIQAKILAAKYVTAPVMTFLDAHIECETGWLEPLLTLVAEDRTVIANPVMEHIRYDSLTFISTDAAIFGMFDWTFVFNWEPIPERERNRTNDDPTAAIRTPGMVGGLFSMDREFFYKLGAYDGGMIIWSGDDVELSIRSWVCGGKILVAPCSRVGHLTRAQRIHAGPLGWFRLMLRNTARLVDVWADEWSEYFYTVFPQALAMRTNVDERKQLRKKLRCKSFRWFLKNVYPESTLNLERIHFGLIESKAIDGLCIDSNGGRDHVPHLQLVNCQYTNGNHVYVVTKRHEIRTRLHCLDAESLHKRLFFKKCHGNQGTQKFAYRNETRSFEYNDTGYCLTADDDIGYVQLKLCDGSAFQEWNFVRVKRYKREEN